MATRVRLQNPFHSSLLLQRANEMRRSRMLCDTLITVGGQEFHAHSLVLACSSRKFQVLFQGHVKHCSLDFLTGRTFQQILEFSYTEGLEASTEDLKCLLAAAELLEMEVLEQECLKILRLLSPQKQRDSGALLGSSVTDTMAGTKRNTDKDSNVGGALNGTPHFESSSHTSHRSSQSQKDMTPSRKNSGDLPRIPFPVHQMRSSSRVKVHCGSSGVTNRLGSLHPQAIPEDMEGVEPPSPISGTSPMMVGTMRTSMSSESGVKTRGSVITTAPHLTPSPTGAIHPWTTDAVWGSSDGMLIAKSSQPVQHHPTVWSYQLRALPPPPFPVTSPAHTAFSSTVGFPGYLQPFQQGLHHGQFGSRQSSLDMAAAGMYEVSCNGAALTTKTHLEDQKKLLNPAMVYRCEICQKHFMDGLCLRMHLLSHTCSQLLPCTQCEVFFSSAEELEAHSQTHTKGDVSSSYPVLCLVCGKRFSSQRGLREHVSVHAGGWNCRCTDCKRAFSSQTALRRHLKTHTGKNQLECEFCSRYFRDENTLRNHKRMHTGEKVYECNSCGKKFSLKHQLETHLRVHTGEKPFECNLCHQRSRDYSAMIKHLRTHNGAAPYRCTICLEFSSSLSAMQKHMRGHRADEIPANWSIEKTYLYSYNS